MTSSICQDAVFPTPTPITMLREILDPRQAPGEPRRRVFFSHDMDLVVWFDGADQPCAFQLAYDKYRKERAVSWHADRGYAHYFVDDGETGPGIDRTPVLRGGGAFERDRVRQAFCKAASGLPNEITGFVTRHLDAWPG